MKPSLARIRSHVPQGLALPSRFDDFVRAKPPVPIQWDNLYDYDLKRSALEQVVPFLRLSEDFGIVALWYHSEGPKAAGPAVIHIAGYGRQEVLATDFDNFLKGINVQRSGVFAFDYEEEQVFRVPGVSGKPKRTGLPSLQKKFERWHKLHTSLLEPDLSPEGEELRRRIYQVAKRIVRDKQSKVYYPSPPWGINFLVERAAGKLSIKYSDYLGSWYKLPTKYGLEAEAKALLKLALNKRRSRYEISVADHGTVSIDEGRQLLLESPGSGSD
ncbi:hypothetical protein [Luteolibacter soli]|uniref:SMI1/KNR4 family protein n=1 Tax=Luteolibacter soli TaxID=3135280 RepID=A0ABU9AP77_9BACT